LKNKLLWIGGGALALTVVAVVFFSFVYRGPEILTVSAAKSQEGSLQGQALWIKGRIASGSIVRDGSGTRFTLTDSLSNVSTLYRGTLPDEFRPGVEMEVLGIYIADGTFEIVKFGKPPVLCAICHG
jgi:cytochrome c-type biogenesis protein CcmE